MNNLSGDVEKSHETRWQAGKDRPEASEQSQPNAQLSGSTVSLKQSCGGSVPPTQNPKPIQEELLLEVMPTILMPVFKERSQSEEIEGETIFQRVRRIMREGVDE